MFTRSTRLFTLGGFDIKLDPSWLIIATLITWSLAQHYFPPALPGYSQAAYLLMGLTAMLAFFGSLLLHELAHSVVARANGVPIRGITLFLFGGMAEMEAEPRSGLIEFWIAIAGPLMSLVLSLLFWLLAGLVQGLGFDGPLAVILSYLALINLILALFNLVPAFPLDGGRILRAYLWHRTGDILRATRQAARSGTIFALFLIGVGLLGLFQGAAASGLWQIMIGLFVLSAARASYQHQLAHSIFGDRTVAQVMRREPIVLDPAVSLSEVVNEVFLPNRIGFAPVQQGNRLLGTLDQSCISSVEREKWDSERVLDHLTPLDPGGLVTPSMPVEDLLAQISESGKRKYLVVEGETLRGVITLADLTEYLQLAERMHRH